jgi:acetoin utilization deacetylase AcuC-like enzyme
MMALHGRVEQIPAEEASVDDLLRVHTPEHVQRVREAVGAARTADGPVALDEDTRVSEASWDAAMGSLGAAMTAAGAVAEGRYRNAFVATRPPGHHATPDRAMGFCLFNHVAIGARYVQDQGRGRRVLIVDWDVHHGNGTQETFYRDPDVFYLSLHQSPHCPGTGLAEEVGAGAGEGTTLNVPLRPGTPREAYRERFFRALEEAEDRFSPDFVFISCGFDVLQGDPLGGQAVEPEDLFDFTRDVMRLAEEPAGGRVIVLLEGGYVPERVGTGAVAVLRGLAGLEKP